ncbi:MAG: ribonuclease H-like domain-containing protein [Candidatus Woesearchaeota archaeon]|jgi:uncharacterized protein YprB with RNaseH-like and TPR domain
MTSTTIDQTITSESVDLDLKYKNPPLEELVLIESPVSIYVNYKKTKKGEPAAVKLYPLTKLNADVLNWINNLKDDTKQDKLDPNIKKLENDIIPVNKLLKTNHKLYHQLTSWSHVFNQTSTPSAALNYLGFKTQNHDTTIDEYKSNILKLFTKDFILKVFREDKTLSYIDSYIKTTPIELKRAYLAKQYRKEHDKLTIDMIVDEAYPEIEQMTGFQPSEIIWQRPLSNQSIISAITKKYYDKEDILKQGTTTKLGEKLIYFIIHPFNRDNVQRGARKFLTLRYSVEVKKYIDYNHDRITLNLRDDKSKTELSSILEREFSFFLSILTKYDPHLTQFPELQDKIKTPLNKIHDVISTLERSIKKEKEDTIPRISDGRFLAGNESYAIEIKNSEYSDPVTLFKSLSKYQNAKKWVDNSSIDHKLLFINRILKPTIFETTKKKLEKEWIVLDGREYKSLYFRALDLLYSKDENFEKLTMINNKTDMIEMFNLTHETPYIIARNGYNYLRNIINKVQKKNLEYLNPKADLLINHMNFTSNHKFQSEYHLDMTELGIYPTELLKHIPEGLVFFDAEATGFRNMGSDIIMNTFGEMKNSHFIATLYLARTPFEMEQMLKKSKERIDAAHQLITYNGDSYDVPLFDERCFFHFIKYKIDKPGIDLYKTHYKPYSKDKDYPKMALKVFEKQELKLHRRGDIPGADIPEYYTQYILGNEHRIMYNIIAHNFIDVFSLPFVYLHSKGFRFDTPYTEINLNHFNDYFNKINEPPKQINAPIK